MSRINCAFANEPFPDHVCNEDDLVSCDSCDARGCELCLELKTSTDSENGAKADLCPFCYEFESKVTKLCAVEIKSSSKSIAEAAANAVDALKLNEDKAHAQKIVEGYFIEMLRNKLCLLTMNPCAEVVEAGEKLALSLGLQSKVKTKDNL